MSYRFNPLQAESLVPISQIEKAFEDYKHTRSAAAPTSPKTGDTWEEIQSNSLNQWFWNGSLWLSPQIYTQRILFAYMGAYNFQGAMLEQLSPIGTGYFIEKTSVTGFLGGKCDEENYLDFNLSCSALSPAELVLSLKSAGDSISIYKELEIKKYIPVVPNSANTATIYILGNGSPPSIINGNFAVHYRYAREPEQVLG